MTLPLNCSIQGVLADITTTCADPSETRVAELMKSAMQDITPLIVDTVTWYIWDEDLKNFEPSLADHIEPTSYDKLDWFRGSVFHKPRVDPTIVFNGQKVDSSKLLDTYAPPLYDRLDSAKDSFLPVQPIPYLPPSNFKCLNLGCPDRAPRSIRETCYTCGKPMEKIS